MSNSIPGDAVATSVIVILYSTLCLFSSCLLFYLLWKGNSRLTYVSLVAACTSVGTLVSIIQQIYLAVNWRATRTAQYAARAELFTKASSAITGNSLGADLGFFWIQYYTYNVDALLIFFWAFQLLRGMFDQRPHSRLSSLSTSRFEAGTKIFAILFPALLIGIIQIPAIVDSTLAFFILCDMVLAISLVCGSIALATTLYKFVQSKSLFAKTQSSQVASTGAQRSMTATGVDGHGQVLSKSRRLRDRWLIIRFTIAFILLGVFELCVILFQVLKYLSNQQGIIDTSNDFSVSALKNDICQFIPGVTASLVAYLVWGTTIEFLKDTRDLFSCGRPRLDRSPAGVKPKIPSTNNFQRLSKGRNGPNNIEVTTELEVLSKLPGEGKLPIKKGDGQYNVQVWTTEVPDIEKKSHASSSSAGSATASETHTRSI